ncbi:MAG: EI24 domain-containing protein [Myxococcota bacterium]|nr:EI24 domain-containing protein [Myxococcota bacterium]
MNKSLKHLTIGLTAPFLGLRFLKDNPKLLGIAWIPLGLGLIWSIISIIALYRPPESEIWYWRYLGFAYLGIVEGSLFLVQFYIALTSPLLDLISERSEATLGRKPPQWPMPKSLLHPKFWWQSLRTLTEALKLLGFKILLWLISFLLEPIPWLGTPMAFTLRGLATGIDFLDYPLARGNLNLKDKLHQARHNTGLLTGFCLSVFCLSSCPGLGGIMLVPGVIGAAIIVSKYWIFPCNPRKNRAPLR